MQSVVIADRQSRDTNGTSRPREDMTVLYRCGPGLFPSLCKCRRWRRTSSLVNAPVAVVSSLSRQSSKGAACDLYSKTIRAPSAEYLTTCDHSIRISSSWRLPPCSRKSRWPVWCTQGTWTSQPRTCLNLLRSQCRKERDQHTCTIAIAACGTGTATVWSGDQCVR